VEEAWPDSMMDVDDSKGKSGNEVSLSDSNLVEVIDIIVYSS
jgi:hypothetical protein